MVDTTTIEVLRVLVTSVAALATISAIIYTWAWFKTPIKTWTLTGLTALLWSFMLITWSMRYILAVREAPPNSIASIEIFFGSMVLVGYLMFLFGTYNSGPMCKKRIV